MTTLFKDPIQELKNNIATFLKESNASSFEFILIEENDNVDLNKAKIKEFTYFFEGNAIKNILSIVMVQYLPFLPELIKDLPKMTNDYNKILNSIDINKKYKICITIN